MSHVLIVSPLEDIHSFSVAKAIRQQGFEAHIFDSALFPDKWSIITTVDDNNVDCYLNKSDGTVSLDLRHISGVWWRRPQLAVMPAHVQHPSYRQFSIAESEQAFVGSLVARIPNFVNPIYASKRATRKIEQLSVATKCGLHIPKTLITTDPTAAQSFYKASASRCIYKTFTGCDFGFFETRIMTDADLEELWRLPTCPAIFQEHVEGEYDLRVTFVDGELFAAKLLYKQGSHPVDSRVDRIPIEPVELPDSIRVKLLKIVRHFGLLYAAIDMRYSASDGYTFFEVNPEGQFLWIEIETGLPISNAVAKLLIGRRDVLETKVCGMPAS